MWSAEHNQRKVGSTRYYGSFLENVSMVLQLSSFLCQNSSQVQWFMNTTLYSGLEFKSCLCPFVAVQPYGQFLNLSGRRSFLYDDWGGVSLMQLLLGWHKFIKSKFSEQCLALTKCSFIIAGGVLLLYSHMSSSCCMDSEETSKPSCWIPPKLSNPTRSAWDNVSRSVWTCGMSNRGTPLSCIVGTDHLNVQI